jgi:hypothetical protein
MHCSVLHYKLSLLHVIYNSNVLATLIANEYTLSLAACERVDCSTTERQCCTSREDHAGLAMTVEGVSGESPLLCLALPLATALLLLLALALLLCASLRTLNQLLLRAAAEAAAAARDSAL